MRRPANNKMQLTRSGHSRWRPSQLILVLGRPRGDSVRLTSSTRRVVSTIAISVVSTWFLAGCGAHRNTSSRSGVPPCGDPQKCRMLRAAPGISLTVEEQCFVRVHAARCSPTDLCIVDCLLKGSGKNIGGGCWHLCTHPMNLDLSLPQECLSLAPAGVEDCGASFEKG